MSSYHISLVLSNHWLRLECTFWIPACLCVLFRYTSGPQALYPALLHIGRTDLPHAEPLVAVVQIVVVPPNLVLNSA